ncbi:MAG: FIST N-terminal domain-containing protein [Roseobacter sp.]
MNAGKGFQGTHTRSYPVGESVLRKAGMHWAAEDPIGSISRQLGAGPFTLIILLVTPKADFQRIVDDAAKEFAGTDVMACTTAGEISSSGYDEEMILGIGFPADDFASRSILFRDVGKLTPQDAVDRVTLARVALQKDRPDLSYRFAFLAVDGLSLTEDTLAASLAPALMDMPLFGGSAGDGTDFRNTLVSLNGEIAENAAVLNLMLSRYRSKVFSLDHLEPTDNKMVVTDADPAKRIVKTINAEPAAREYARLVGKDPEQLDKFTFAAHPVVVRIGNTHHVRAIQQINDAGEIVFFSAIDEGMVLAVATPRNMAEHLAEKLEALADDSMPTDIFCCDCVLRRIEAEQCQLIRPMSDILKRHNVIGFSTYGEQIGALHVNQTMSGVAFYRPVIE